MKDYIARGMDSSGNIRILSASTTNMVELARKTHGTSPTATAALGRTLTAGIMMGNMLKNKDDVMTLTINGDGPGGIIDVVARNNGKIKGYIENPREDLPSRQDGKLDVGGLVGRNGTIKTVTDLGLKEPYSGSARLVTGEIAEDIANYYVVSEQQPTAISLGVLIDTDTSVRAAGGFMIQLLPGVEDEDIDKIENSLSKVPNISSLIDAGYSPEEIIEQVLKDFEIKILETYDIEYKCDCSYDRVEKILFSLGKEDLRHMIEEDKGAEVICHFCNTKYNFNNHDLEKIILTIEK